MRIQAVFLSLIAALLSTHAVGQQFASGLTPNPNYWAPTPVPGARQANSPRWSVMNLREALQGQAAQKLYPSGNLASFTDSNGRSSRLDFFGIAQHRGAWKNYPENSESAIREAVENSSSSVNDGGEMIEIDVAATSDSFPDTYNLNGGATIPGCIVSHDQILDRLTTEAPLGSAAAKQLFASSTESVLRGYHIRTGRGVYVPQRNASQATTPANRNNPNDADHFLNLYDVLGVLDQYVLPGSGLNYYSGATGPLVVIDVKARTNPGDPDGNLAGAKALLAGCTAQVIDYMNQSNFDHPGVTSTALPYALIFKVKGAVFASPANACVPLLPSRKLNSYLPVELPRSVVISFQTSDLQDPTTKGVLSPSANSLYQSFKNAYIPPSSYPSASQCVVSIEFNQSNASGGAGDPSAKYMDDLDSAARLLGAQKNATTSLGYGYASWHLPYTFPEGFTASDRCCLNLFFDQVTGASSGQFVFPDYRAMNFMSLSRIGETNTTTDQIDSLCSILQTQGRRDTSYVDANGSAITGNPNPKPIPSCPQPR